MKYIIIILFFVFGISNAQTFESNVQKEEEKQEKTQFFEKDVPAPPEQRESDYPTGPGPEAPIDDWLFLLPLAGIAVGAYYLNKIQKAKA